MDVEVEKRLVKLEKARRQEDFETRLSQIILESEKALEKERRSTNMERHCVRLGASVLLMLTILAMVLAKLSDVIHAVLDLWRGLHG